MVGLNGLAHVGGELSRRHLRRIDLSDPDQARLLILLERQAQGAGAGLYGALTLVEGEEDRLLAPCGGRQGIGQGEGGFADPRRADEQRIGAALQPAAEHLVELRVAAGGELPREGGMVLGGHQPRMDVEAAPLDGEVVEAAPEWDAAHLHHPHAPPLGAVVYGQLLQHHHPVGDGVELQVVLRGGEIVEQDHGALTLGEEVLQGQHLAPVAQRALGQEAQLREAVDHHPARV